MLALVVQSCVYANVIPRSHLCVLVDESLLATTFASLILRDDDRRPTKTACRVQIDGADGVVVILVANQREGSRRKLLNFLAPTQTSDQNFPPKKPAPSTAP